MTAGTLPGVKHKVIGLVSGGKDSCFNLMHAVANGHEIVALATLTPEAGIDELDSHMYQSVGTDIPPLIAKAMDLPHFSRVIKGRSVEQGAEYGSRERGGEGSGREGDETEDLTELLLDVMAEHPDATAVASGAILSNYQRLRIEHVCQRLKLTSLAYLWQSEQLPLVGRMISSGLEAVLVKVAGVGLGEAQIGKTLGQLFPLLTRLQMQYGAHPAGEGGEYETLTLDTPLFSHRINFVDSEIVVTDPEPYCVAYLRIKRAELVPKEGWKKPSVAELREILGLDETEEGAEGLDEQGRELLEQVKDTEVVTGDVTSSQEFQLGRRGSCFGRRGRWFTIMAEGETRQGETVGDELRSAMESIKDLLSTHNLSLPLHAAHITLLLSSMSLFPEANAAYVQYFGSSPPSRATVAVPLPANQRIRIEVVGFDEGDKPIGNRSALHVQGLSYWAPANIGPYSQAVQVNSRLHIAGQIPLLPPSLTFAAYPQPPKSPYPHQATLALQHVRKIIQVLRNPNSTGGGWTGWVESCVAWWARPEGCGVEGPAVAQKAWKVWAEENGSPKTPVIFVRATELPRGALVEYQVNLHVGREGYEHVPSDDDDDDEDLEASYASGPNGKWQTCTAPSQREGSRAAIFLSDEDDTVSSSEVDKVLSRAVTIRAYHTPGVDPAGNPLIRRAEAEGACWTGVPVLEVQNLSGISYGLALEVFSA